MSKRLFIWIGLIILVGVISAAGWSVYVTFNHSETEAPPPPVRGKIPQMPKTSSGTTIHRVPVPPTPVIEQAMMTAAEQATPAVGTQVTLALQSRIVDPALTDRSPEQPPTVPQEQPTIEPMEQAAVEMPADQSDAQDSEIPPTPEPLQAQSKTPTAPAAEPEPETLSAQQDTPDSMSAKQPAPPEQSSAPSTSGTNPAAGQAAKSKPPAHSRFTIQVGAYRNKSNAENTLSLLSRKRYEAYIFENSDAKSRTWYVVRFGHFPTRQAAQWALSAYQDKEQKKAIIVRSGG